MNFGRNFNRTELISLAEMKKYNILNAVSYSSYNIRKIYVTNDILLKSFLCLKTFIDYYTKDPQSFLSGLIKVEDLPNYDKYVWHLISVQKNFLSEDFIIKFEDKLHWNAISEF
jgi:hypothetical protein